MLHQSVMRSGPPGWLWVFPFSMSLMTLAIAFIDYFIWAEDPWERRVRLKVLMIVSIAFLVLSATVLRGLFIAFWRLHPLYAIGIFLSSFLAGYLVAQEDYRRRHPLPEPRLRDIETVERALREAERPLSIDELYGRVSDAMDYGVYRRVLDYLEDRGLIRLTEKRRIIYRGG